MGKKEKQNLRIFGENDHVKKEKKLEVTLRKN